MDARLLDVIISVIYFCILIVLLGFSPNSNGTRYRLFHCNYHCFIVALSGAGYLVNKQIA